MAVTVDVAGVAAAIRVGDTTEEITEVTRLRTYAIEAVTRYLADAFDAAPDAVVNEAVIRLVGYLYDIPSVSRGQAFAHSLRNSGAASMLLPYRGHGLTSTQGDAGSAPAPGPGPGPGPGPVGAGVDQVARDGVARLDAEIGDRQGTPQSVSLWNQVLDNAAKSLSAENRSVANAARLMPPAPAEAQAGTATAIRGWTAALIRTLVESIVPAWAREASPPAGAEVLAEFSKRQIVVNQVEIARLEIPAGDANQRLDLSLTFVRGQTRPNFAGRMSIELQRYFPDTDEWVRVPGSAILGEVLGEGPITRAWSVHPESDAAVTYRWWNTVQNGGRSTFSMREASARVASEQIIPPYNQEETSGLLSRAGVLFWRVLNLVPDTPGESSGVGHVLTVTGEGDRDYAFRALPASSGTDQAARDAAAVADGKAVAAAAAAAMADGKADVNAAAIAKKQDALTHADLINLLQFDVVPGTIIGYDEADVTQDWRVWVAGGDTIPDTWMSLTLNGVTTLAAPAPSTIGANLQRHKLSATNIYQFTLSEANRKTLADGRKNLYQGRAIEAALRFHDANTGGALVDIVNLGLDWLAKPEGSSAAASVPGWTLVNSRAITASTDGSRGLRVEAGAGEDDPITALANYIKAGKAGSALLLTVDGGASGESHSSQVFELYRPITHRQFEAVLAMSVGHDLAVPVIKDGFDWGVIPVQLIVEGVNGRSGKALTYQFSAAPWSGNLTMALYRRDV